MKKKLVSFCLILPLTILTACQSSYDKFYVPYNLDIIVSEQETYSPTTISPVALRSMIQTKQSFALYYYSNNCSACVNSSELLDEYLSKRKTQIYKISSTDIYHLAQENNPLEPFMFLFRATPNIYFFNNGELTATLPRNKYSSGYNVFESTLNEIMMNSFIFNTTKYIGLSKFLESNQEYLIYISTNKDIDTTTYNSLSYNTFSNIVYPKMSQSEYSTLSINVDYAEPSLISFIETEYGIDNLAENSHVAIYKYRENIAANDFETGVIYYDTVNNQTLLDEMISNHLLKRDYKI